MRTRPRLHLLIIISLLASAVASLAAVAGTSGTAHACSIAGPYAQSWPSSDLSPGQQIEIAGWGFYDIRVHEPAPPVPPVEVDVALPPELCNFDTVAMGSLDVDWRGTTSAWLGAVSGPDFSLSAAVPFDAAPGPATIVVGPVELIVYVGGDPEPPPPPPCPLAVQPNESSHRSCPDLWPCPLHGAASTQPAPGEGRAPGFTPPCPEPCVDYAHTIDDGTVYDYRWDCPDPCSQTEVSPGAGEAALAVWCPPPCQLVGGDAFVCPEPCLTSADSPVFCPDRCGLSTVDAEPWCSQAEVALEQVTATKSPTVSSPSSQPAAGISTVSAGTSIAVMDLVEAIANQLLLVITGLRLTLFG